MKTINHSKTASPLTDYLNKLFAVWQAQPYAPAGNLIDYGHLGISQQALTLLGHGPCITWVLDLRTREFVFLSDNTRLLIGYEPALFKNDGFRFWCKLMHPEDKQVIGEMTLNLWQNIFSLPTEKRLHYRFSRKYRVRKPDGSFVCLLEQNKVLQTDVSGNITHVLGTCSDITDLIKMHAFEACVQVASGKLRVQQKPEEERAVIHTKLSEREKEIVRLVAEGLSSKLIADQLFISFHTVNTHRKNIIGKTHTKNTSGLVQYAISNRII